jgi:hypothetical protein
MNRRDFDKKSTGAKIQIEKSGHTKILHPLHQAYMQSAFTFKLRRGDEV